MQVSFLVLVITLACSPAFADESPCVSTPASSGADQKWITMIEPCAELVRAQVQTELSAAITYLAMGAHFSKDTVNRPGFAKLFFESANEEREHAIKLINYLLMRGELKTEIPSLIKNPYPEKKDLSWEGGWSALKAALELETKVTESINEIIKKCEHQGKKKDKDNTNDYHIVDYLTGEFLEEQYKGERDLAGKLFTLEKMNSTFGDLGEYLFDKKLLNKEIPILP